MKQSTLDLEHDGGSVQRGNASIIFQLPRELRDKIYEYLWQDVILGFRQDGFVVIARCNDKDIYESPDEPPCWLSVCRQLRSESVEHICRTATFWCGNMNWLPEMEHNYFSDMSTSWTSVLENALGLSLAANDAVILRTGHYPADVGLLQHAKHVRVSLFEILWDARYENRDHCREPAAPLCTNHCCSMALAVSIGSAAGLNFPRLLTLLGRERDGVEVELTIGPGSVPSSIIFTSDTNVVKKTHYDWSFFDSVEKCSRH
jgi:hypothetical protein